MARTLERYVLGEVTRAFVAAVGLAVSVLFVLRIVEFVDLAFSRGVPARLVGALAAYVVPSFLEIAVPMAALLAVVVVFARLGADGELLALRASGLRLGQVTRPLVVFSLLVAMTSLVLGVWARPWANRGIHDTTVEMARTRLTASLRPGVFNAWFGGVVLFVDALDPGSGEMQNVMLSEERERYGRKTVFASSGFVESNENADTAYLLLRSGSLLTYHPSGKYHDKTDFGSIEMNLDMADDTVVESQGASGPSALDFSALLAERRERLARGDDAMEETLELHRKLVLPVAALFLPFVGVPLGAAGRRGVKSRGLVISTAVVLLYYLMLTGAVTLARQQTVPIALAMWTPNVLLAVVAVTLFRRASAERPLWAIGRVRRRS